MRWLAILMLVAGCDGGLPIDGDDMAAGADLAGGDMRLMTDPKYDFGSPGDDLAGESDLAAAPDLSPGADLLPAPDLLPTVDMQPAPDLLMCVARGSACAAASSCCEPSAGCQFLAGGGIDRLCCGGLGATCNNNGPSGSPCCPNVPSGSFAGTTQGCYVPGFSGALQCCIRSLVADPNCAPGQMRARYRCSDSGGTVDGDCL